MRSLGGCFHKKEWLRNAISGKLLFLKLSIASKSVGLANVKILILGISTVISAIGMASVTQAEARPFAPAIYQDLGDRGPGLADQRYFFEFRFDGTGVPRGAVFTANVNLGGRLISPGSIEWAAFANRIQAARQAGAIYQCARYKGTPQRASVELMLDSEQRPLISRDPRDCYFRPNGQRPSEYLYFPARLTFTSFTRPPDVHLVTVDLQSQRPFGVGPNISGRVASAAHGRVLERAGARNPGFLSNVRRALATGPTNVVCIRQMPRRNQSGAFEIELGVLGQAASGRHPDTDLVTKHPANCYSIR